VPLHGPQSDEITWVSDVDKIAPAVASHDEQTQRSFDDLEGVRRFVTLLEEILPSRKGAHRHRRIIQVRTRCDFDIQV